MVVLINIGCLYLEMLLVLILIPILLVWIYWLWQKEYHIIQNHFIFNNVFESEYLIFKINMNLGSILQTLTWKYFMFKKLRFLLLNILNDNEKTFYLFDIRNYGVKVRLRLIIEWMICINLLNLWMEIHQELFINIIDILIINYNYWFIKIIEYVFKSEIIVYFDQNMM